MIREWRLFYIHLVGATGFEPATSATPLQRATKLRHAPIVSGGGTGIRTLEGLSPLPVFKTGAFNRSAIPPAHGAEYYQFLTAGQGLVCHQWLLIETQTNLGDAITLHLAYHPVKTVPADVIAHHRVATDP